MIQFSLQKKLHSPNGFIILNAACKIEKNAFVSLYGVSGAGKTTLLRMLAGFMKPDAGYIKINDEVWFDDKQKINKPSQQRLAGFVFQDYALFPNMNVEQNISFALSKNDSKKIVDELLEITALTGLRNKKIQTLSGGQQQRVALARALAIKPKLLLLDEPLSAIDIEMRSKLQDCLRIIHSSFDVTIIIVSHDVNEIIKLTSKILYLHKGIIQDYQSPLEFFSDKFTDASIIKGTFLSAEKSGNDYTVLILIGDKLVKIAADENDYKDYKRGDEITISLNNENIFARIL